MQYIPQLQTWLTPLEGSHNALAPIGPRQLAAHQLFGVAASIARQTVSIVVPVFEFS